MIDEQAFKVAREAFARELEVSKTSLGQDLRVAIEAYVEAAKAEPAERPMRERLVLIIMQKNWSAYPNHPAALLDAILIELATPSRGMIEAMETRMSQAPHRGRMVIDYIEAWRAALLAARGGSEMAEFDAAGYARDLMLRLHAVNPEDAASVVVRAFTEAHAAGRAEGLRRAAEIAERFSGPQLAALIESELEATNGK